MDRLSSKICQLAENLLIKGELIIWRRFSLGSLSTLDIEIAPICNQQSERIVVEKIIASSIVDSNAEEDGSTTYIVEVLAAICNVSSVEENNFMVVNGGSNNSYEHSVTFTIGHQPDNTFVLLDVML
ncbi:hypothetical protein [Chamaesiphon minutus]|uniref:Uncharacterized protein n=1 Tax=Chamaesiphon minutus (strain ATCC 27169 / PCC 6605) TaxID=1173020 RepID=K9UEL1_CHAP6|nr:hypothetical protein [Chamaesiphon minutus]AFY92851.1 hypothetical protein Cha6605_1726 [Chamaesiphon minutus PCC 6605]